MLQFIISLYFIFTLSQVCAEYPFRNISLPLADRVDDLVHRLSVEELVTQMTKGGGGGDGGPVPAIGRLGIGKYWWGTECIHGDIYGTSTSFPQSIGLAAAYSPDLIRAVAEAVSNEVRARNNDFVKRGIYETHTGLNCFSPVINIMRHPLWGRNQETYGEDPFLSGVYAENFVQGLIGSHPKYYRANAICKHFDAYNGPEDLPQSRLSFNAQVPERDLHMTYLPQFKHCVTGGALGAMCSYNSVNGIPACANKYLMTDVLRKSWNFTGFVISDSGAVEFLILNHRYIQNIEDAAVACVKAGLNLELHAGQYAKGAFDWLTNAVADGKISKKLLQERVKPLFFTRMKLGEFDPSSLNPYLKLNLSIIQSPAHRQLSTLAAMKSFVLLKNNGVLPIRKLYKTVAIIGPFADNPEQQMGNYAPDIDKKYMTTVRSGLSPLGEKVIVTPGCSNTRCLDYDATKVRQTVKAADFIVLCLGTGQTIETENFDRPYMLLPGYQSKMLTDVMQYARGPVILLTFSAGPMDIRQALQPAVSAIIHCFFPAQATGEALYNVLTGKNPDANLGGRLPFTWYKSDAQVPAMVDYSMFNKTYRYFQGEPLFPFGYGLSYSTFQCSDLTLVPSRVEAGQNVTVDFKISNTGNVSGDEVYQVYISWLNSTVPTPIYQLVAFNRTMVDKGQTVMVSTVISSESMAVWKDGKGFVIEPGDIAVYVGGQMPNQKTKVPSNVLKAIFTIYT